MNAERPRPAIKKSDRPVYEIKYRCGVDEQQQERARTQVAELLAQFFLMGSVPALP